MLGQGEGVNPGCLYDAGAGHCGAQQAIFFVFYLSLFQWIFLTTCKVFIIFVQHIEDAAFLTGFDIRDVSTSEMFRKICSVR